MTRARGRGARAAVILGVALGALALPGAALAGRWVIPPGQEALAARILGGELPGGCRFAGATIARTAVQARYTCADGERRLELRHPSDAPPGAVRAEQLALVAPEEGAPPAALMEALRERLRAEEAGWRWVAEGRAVGRTLAEAGLPARTRRLVLPLGVAAALAFAATLLLSLGLARRLARPAAVAAPRAWRRELAAAAVTVGLAYLYLALAYPAAPVHADTTRDLLMAADCLAGLPCDHGPPTTLGVIVQGSLWTRWLALGRALGLGLAATQAATHLAFALSAGVMLLSTRRRLGAAVAAPAAALYTVGAAALLGVPILWNPSLAALPLAVFHALLVALAWDREGEARPLASLAVAAGAGLALGLAIDCHVLFAVLVPALLAAVAGTARRPILALPAAAGALVATLLAGSAAAWRVNARAFVEAGAALPLLALLLLAVVTAGLARGRLLALPPRARAAVFVGAAAAYTAGATAVLFGVLGPAAGVRYLVPAVPGLALAAATLIAHLARALAARLRARPATEVALVAALTLLVVAAVRVAAAPNDSGWTFADVEAIAPDVYRRAPSYRDVLAQARARTSAAIPALGLLEPRGAPPGGEGREEILLFLLPRASAPRAGGRLSVVRRGGHAVVAASVDPFLDAGRALFCFAPRAGASAEMGCAAGGVPRAPAGPETPEERAYPVLQAVRDAFPTEVLRRFGGLRQSITIPIRTSPGAAHRVLLYDEGSGYRIEKVTGVPARGELPGRRVVLEGVRGEGELTLAREDSGQERADRYWMPALVEVPEDDPELLRVAEDPRVR